MADTLCFFACCKTKTDDRGRYAEKPALSAASLPGTWTSLQSGRKAMTDCINEYSTPCGALFRYDGNFFRVEDSFRDDLVACIRADRLDCYILSAGYGVVHALDPIHSYEAEMKGEVARTWRRNRLPDVIAELVRVSNAHRVFGFFAGPTRWSGAHAKYRHFFTEGVKAAIAGGATLESAACFYRSAGRGTTAITGALGRALLHGIRADFSSDFMDKYAAGHQDGKVTIRADSLIPSRPAGSA